jgi:hypothetical protein
MRTIVVPHTSPPFSTVQVHLLPWRLNRGTLRSPESVRVPNALLLIQHACYHVKLDTPRVDVSQKRKKSFLPATLGLVDLRSAILYGRAR